MNRLQRALVAEGMRAIKGTVTYVEIKHDDWCPAVSSQKTDDCICDFELVVSPPYARGAGHG